MKHNLAATVTLAMATAIPTLAAPHCAALSAQSSTQQAGQVIYSRSVDENGEIHSEGANQIPGKGAAQMVNAPSAEDAERDAVTFTDFDMDVHLRTAEQHLAVRALLTVRNDGKAPLARIPLQISFSLNWERIRVNGRDVGLQVATLNSDSDHTGQLHEAAVQLARPLAPGASQQLDVTYSGTIAPTAQRLTAIGTPDDVALHSDWDRISTSFTGLRGFGNVVWYPVSSVPVILGDGARLFDEIGEHKLRLSGAHFRLRLVVEFPHGQAPTVALINGHPVPLFVTESGSLDPSQEVASVATATLDGSTLGFESPSLFAAIRTAHAGANVTGWTLEENSVAVGSWVTAAAAVTPFLQGWLGQKPRSQLTLLDLPDPEDVPFETGALLATSLRNAGPDQLNGIMAHALTHAWMQSPRAWLSEGVAHFMGTLWVEKQRGRDVALGSLEATRQALSLAEPESPGQSPGQPLAESISPVYFRTKATYVLWMLRDIVGDAPLSAALRAYNPAQDIEISKSPSAFERLLERAGDRSNLGWFFSDWIDADKGLPDLTIDSVFPSPERAGNWLVAVNVSNSGYAAAEFPITVHSAGSSVTQRVLVPARGKATPRILIQGKPFEVLANDGTIPETEATIHIVKLGDAAVGADSSGQTRQ